MKLIQLLFVEDDITDQMSFKRFVKREKLLYKYDIAGSFAEAVELLKQNTYELVLTDHALGDGTGLDLFDYIPKNTPVIFVTGAGNEEVAVNAMKKGACDYISKDIEGNHLRLLPIVIENVLKAKAIEVELEIYRNHLEYMVEQRTLELEQEISKRKIIEQQLRLLATSFETHEGIVITDASAVVLRVNTAFSDITGYSAEEVIGKNINFLKSGKQDGDFYKAMWRQLLETGRYEGELWNRRKNGEIYPEWLTITGVKNEEGDVSHYVGLLSDITKQKNTEIEIKKLAFYDPLTSLANRRLLLDRLNHEIAIAKRNKIFGSVIFLDLDGFKSLNDNFGHHIGDELLIQVANRLNEVFREEDTVSRLGGDEFIILIHAEEPDLKIATNNAMLIAEKVLEKLNAPYFINEHKHQFTSSIGVTLFPCTTFEPEEILQAADKAMYQSKNDGKNTINLN
ncbi:MAG: diguanylate cyclase [Methylococcaceae bacterium]|nr:diguanylate cyclase [Methylococcaceae bacterium]